MRVELRKAQEVVITTLVDNYTDSLMGGSEEVKRPTLSRKGEMGKPLLAEHGFAALIEIRLDGDTHKVLMDAGTTEKGIFHNLESLELDLDDIEAIVLSHGHPDHNAALVKIIESLPVEDIPLITHPDAFLKRRIRIPGREEVILPEFKKESLEEAGAEVIKNREPYLLTGGSLLVTGEVPRVTDFEKGFPPNYAEIDGVVQPDPMMHDDQALVMRVEGKGLIVLSGCAHAGIINSTLYARELTGGDKVHVILGGFHLSGPLFEPLIDRTIAEIKEIGPKMVVPTHCTGSNAMFRFRQEMPEVFVHNCVGTKFVF
mgnify:CR=1 FL=1